MLVDARWDPPPVPDDPPEEPRRQRRTWRLGDFRAAYWLVAGLALALASGVLAPGLAYIVLLGACGLKDHRQ